MVLAPRLYLKVLTWIIDGFVLPPYSVMPGGHQFRRRTNDMEVYTVGRGEDLL